MMAVRAGFEMLFVLLADVVAVGRVQAREVWTEHLSPQSTALLRFLLVREGEEERERGNLG